MRVLCGTDIVKIETIEKMLNDEVVLRRFFDSAELTTRTSEHLAGIVAAKEAFFKAVGMIPKWTDILVQYSSAGKPLLKYPHEFNYITSCDVSISHDGDYAVAFVVLLTQ